MNNSEVLLNAFSESFFFKELTFSELEFYVDSEHKVELADLLINLGDTVLAIQLKSRDEKSQTYDEIKESSWVEKKCRAAKSQINDTISYIRNHKLTFKSNYGQCVEIGSSVKIVPLVVFENEAVIDYEHILRKHNSDGIDVNCMSLDDYRELCSQLVSPREIISYLEWRKDFYLQNGSVNMLLMDTKWGFSISKPQKGEALVMQYLMEMYGDNAVFDTKDYLLKFNAFVSELSIHTVDVSEESANVEIIKLLAHFYHNEIRQFVDKIELAVRCAKDNDFGIKGSLRNVERKSMTAFIASKSGEYYDPKKLFDYSNEGGEITILLQVIMYWVNVDEFRIDFSLYKEAV